MTQRTDAAPAPALVPRWGVRVLGCLATALLAVVCSWAQGAYSVATLALLLAGLAGACWCSTRGLAALYAVPPDRRVRGRSREVDDL